MKRKITVAIGLIVCAVLCVMGLIGCQNKKDNGPEIKPAETIRVKNAQDLMAAAQYVGVEYSAYTILLENDIDLSEVEWRPIGQTLSRAFCGTFDGNNKTISGLTITGWNSLGQPEEKNIAKQIIGWLDNGTRPVYKSDEIVKVEKGEPNANGLCEVTKIIKEGDDGDDNYKSLAKGDGEFETSVSYGSVGLFGYTSGATIKDLKVSGADISFYTSGEYTYAGIISGYDVASTFDNVIAENGKIAISTTYQVNIFYYDKFGVPYQPYECGINNQYVGGLIGYSKGNTAYDATQKTFVRNNTKLLNVQSNNFTFDNTNYSAHSDIGLVFKGTEGDSRMYVSENVTKGTYEAYEINSLMAGMEYVYPVQAYVGGAVGYIYEGQMDGVTVNGFNKATKTEGSNKTTGIVPVMARSAYFGGIAGGLYRSDARNSNASNVFISSIDWADWQEEKIDQAVLYFKEKATVGGAYGILCESTVNACGVNAVYAEIGGRDLQSVCVGGFAGYADDSSEIEGITVNDAYLYSTYTGVAGSSEASDLGSVMAGGVGVLRNSSLKNATIDNVRMETKDKQEATYIFVKSIVSQMYGNAVLSYSSAKNIEKYSGRTTTYVLSAEEKERMLVPTQSKNTIVNEDGYNSIRLYYSPDGTGYADTYVTVYGELLPKDQYNNVLISEDIYKKVNLPYQNGDTIPSDLYYVSAGEDNYIFIWKDSFAEFKIFDSAKLYAEKLSVYRVQFAEENKNMALAANTYYEYDSLTATFELTQDMTAASHKTYYILKNDETIKDYYLDIVVYAESGKKIVIDQKDEEDTNDDVLAEARYALTKAQVTEAQTKDGDYVLAIAEIYLSTYFQSGVGFKADINNVTIRYYDSTVENRNFANYILVSGRPTFDQATVVNQ